MIHESVRQRLHAQIGHELGASQQYLATAVYFGHRGLDRWAEAFYRQSLEEREHALKIVRFLVDVGAEFDFPAIPVAKPDFQSPLDAVERALAWERTVTRQFNEMCDVALQNKDFTSFQFLQWFVEEQVEEEALIGKYVQMIRGGSDLFVLEKSLGETEEESCECED